MAGQNNNCDGSGPCAPGEVRVLSMGPDNGNLILCANCFTREIAFRRSRNKDLAPDAAYSLPAWNDCPIYSGEGEAA